MREFIWAFKFLTVVPIDRADRVTTDRYHLVMVWFPVVGLILGVLLVAIGFGLIQAGFPDAVTAALVLLVLTVLTGALHVDGLADAADGLFGGSTRERRLEIMRDSRIGAFGAVAVLFDYLLRYTALLAIMQTGAFLILTAGVLGFMPVAGRWAQVLGAALSKYARAEEGTGKAFLDSVSWPAALMAAIVPAAYSLLLLGLTGLWMFLASALVALAVVLLIRRRIGGMTGDTLGAVNEVAEVAYLLTAFIFVSPDTNSPLVNFVLLFVKL